MSGNSSHERPDDGAQRGARGVLGAAREAVAAAERDYALATALRLDEDYDGALAAYRRAAEQGHAKAQNDVGAMLLHGLGAAADPAAAVPWYRKAAEQGLAEAQFNLAARYLNGSGVAQDDEEAARWLAQAAQQGDVDAIAQLGTLFRLGQGVPQDLAAAADLHAMAAAAGDAGALGQLESYRDELERTALAGSAQASLTLAQMHEEGLAVDPDPIEAWAWLCWAQERADDDEETADDLADDLAEREATLGRLLDQPDRRAGMERLDLLRRRAQRA
jgi:hypothetical protein